MSWFMSLRPLDDDNYEASFPIDKIKPVSQSVTVDSGRQGPILFAVQVSAHDE